MSSGNHNDLMAAAKEMGSLVVIPVGAGPGPAAAPELGQGEDLPVCDVTWCLEHAAKGGYGISYSDRQIQNEVRKACVLVKALLDADREYNLAHSNLRQAERDGGGLDSLPGDHPVVVRYRDAAERRGKVLSRALGIKV